MSAQTRASLHLTASTSLDPTTALHAVKAAAGEVKGGGASLLTTGIQNLGAQVNVERENGSTLVLSITSGKRLVELCTFSVQAQPAQSGTELTVGGLDTYRTTQSTMLGFIPVGPKMIAGYAPYRTFLNAVQTRLRGADPAASVTIAERG